ncbi:MAG TPA: aspartate 1-decarboxylase [Longimicrobiales bacterium]
MQRVLCKSKIHRATVTGADLNYEGSITIDAVLMDAADIVEYEQVQVVNINNGARFETYAIRGEPGSGAIVLNGAAARLAQPGDRVIILSYARYDASELEGFAPRLVFVDAENRPVTGAAPADGPRIRFA